MEIVESMIASVHVVYGPAPARTGTIRIAHFLALPERKQHE